MPFDGNGNFIRDYDWQEDRDNGIRIVAARMDDEFDNFGAGLTYLRKNMQVSVTYTASGGNPTPPTNYWFDDAGGSSIFRMASRLMVGQQSSGNKGGGQGGIFDNSAIGANWASRDADFCVQARTGLIAVAGISRANDKSNLVAPTECIGVAGFVLGNLANRAVWGLYSDVQFEDGTYGYGLEIAAKNKGADKTSTPYFNTTGVIGIWLPAGGDASYGGAPANPNNFGLGFGFGSSTWNKGIVFFKDALTGTDGVTGTATAIEMAKGHTLSWRAPGNFFGARIRSDVATNGSGISVIMSDNAFQVLGGNDKPLFSASHSLNGANYLSLRSQAIASTYASLTAQGDAAVIDVYLEPKGATGRARLGGLAAYVATGDVPITGYFEIRDINGVLRKLAVVA